MKNEQLIRRFQIERKKFDRSGIYAYTQRILAYNSNKIEGSTLNEEQTASLFDTGMLPVSNDYYRAKDIEETNGHFLMFNKMIDTLDEPLSEALIKAFHYELKSGVFEEDVYKRQLYAQQPAFGSIPPAHKPVRKSDRLHKQVNNRDTV